MSDPLGFPVLASSAITQTFAFLYGRLAALLGTRADARHKTVPDDELPPTLRGQLAPLEVDQGALERLRATLQALDDTLGVYKDNPNFLDGEDVRLRRNLGRLRDALEVVYHQRFTFEGEERPPTGLKVEQRVDEVAGELSGLKAESINAGAKTEIIQVSKKVNKGGKMLGADIRKIDNN